MKKIRIGYMRIKECKALLKVEIVSIIRKEALAISHPSPTIMIARGGSLVMKLSMETFIP
jgi:hypothetical protein